MVLAERGRFLQIRAAFKVRKWEDMSAGGAVQLVGSMPFSAPAKLAHCFGSKMLLLILPREVSFAAASLYIDQNHSGHTKGQESRWSKTDASE